MSFIQNAKQRWSSGRIMKRRSYQAIISKRRIIAISPFGENLLHGR
ncbi:hypothetical protein CEV31_0694 [Brucella thiophenivorans]|uniref:Uncharacterized protein n=1 Tax=Brucella thiophenivorans TaxID=571255 RepID=A0A256G1W7_9HYPH|nr:hypothetical protein CEV31_0694 [Brucella thiophenivorans]